MSPSANLVRALFAGAVAAALAAGSIAPASATDLEALRRRAQAIADQLTDLEYRKADLESKRAELETKIERATQELGALALEIDDLGAELDAARSDYVGRAVEIYKAGSDTRLALLLSAKDVNELATIAHATGATTDAAERALDRLEVARADAEAAQERVDARKQDLLVVQRRVATLSAEIGITVAQRSAVLDALTQQIDRLVEEARRAATIAAQTGYSSGYRLRPSEELLALLAPAGPSQGIPEAFIGTGVTFEGIASWYGPGFEGNRTASGDIFDSRLYTAASKELPLGTWLYIEHEGRGVVVLINDRGPYVGDRILDLSHAAAQAIGIGGLGWVKAEVLIQAKG